MLYLNDDQMTTLDRQHRTQFEQRLFAHGRTHLPKRCAHLDDAQLRRRLTKLTQDPLFTQKHQDWLKKNRTPANEARIKAHWQNLSRFGVAMPTEMFTQDVHP